MPFGDAVTSAQPVAAEYATVPITETGSPIGRPAEKSTRWAMSVDSRTTRTMSGSTNRGWDNTGMIGPYRRPTPTALEYGEGVPDQEGEGYRRNIVAQLDLRGIQHITLCEIDNPDAYPLASVLLAIDWATGRGIQVLAKNPGVSNLWQEDSTAVVAHPNVVGIIVERGAGTAHGMHALRQRAGKPELPVRFVSYDDGAGGEDWANAIAREITAQGYRDMGVTYCSALREYASSSDVLRPVV